jgi:hypothetical protein
MSAFSADRPAFDPQCDRNDRNNQIEKFPTKTSDRLSLQSTADGSQTFFSDQFQEAFHSHHGAKQEAIAKFVEPTQIAEKVRGKVKSNQSLRILDVCYGLGYNTAAAVETAIATLSELVHPIRNQTNIKSGNICAGK